MKFKKVTAFCTAALMAVTALSGCSVQKAQETESTADGKVKIVVDCWPNEDSSPKAYENAMRKKAEFEELYPDIVIEGESWAYDTKTFLARAEGGTLPTLYRAPFTEAKKIIQFKYAADITDYVKEYDYYGKINETMLGNVSENGSIYLLPRSAYTLGMIINAKLFREAGLVDESGKVLVPRTFDEVAAYAQTIKEKTGQAGFVFPTAENAGGWNFTMLAWNYGTEFMKQENGKWQSVFASEECAAALDFLKDLKWNKNALPANTKVNNAEVIKLIGTNQAAMAIAHPDQLHNLMKDYAMNTEDIVMITMPQGPKRHVTLMGGSYYAIAPNATPEQIDAAFKWMQFDGLTTEMDDAAKARYETDQKTRFEENFTIIGVKDLSIWNNSADVETFKNEIHEKYRNIPAENVVDYNENKDSVEYQTEEEICAQDLYGILDNCIQEVLTNESSDSMEVLKKAAADFQSNFLDYEN